MDVDLPFGRWLKRRRVELRLTQFELAQRVNYSVVTIRKIESEELRPSVQIAERLAQELGITAEDHAAFVRFARGEATGNTRQSEITKSALPDRWYSDALSEHPPLRLPLPPTAMIGRRQEVADVRHLLLNLGARLVTLTGSGGVGKTRLALGIAEELSDHFSNGVVFVDLAPVRSSHLVTHAIAAALGVQMRASAPLLGTLQDYLQHKELLLLLDNFEQVISAAPVVAQLLSAAPGLNILVTSREVLRLRGEHEFRVLPLATPASLNDLTALADSIRRPDAGRRTGEESGEVEELLRYPAIALFVRQAVATQPDFVLTVENAAPVVDICARLEGIPLAIELAAARMKLFTPSDLVERLGSRLDLLVGGARDLPARQRTLRDTLAWSYDLLATSEQLLFRRLAVFVGGFTLQTAEAVCYTRSEEGSGSVPTGEVVSMEELESLIDKTLLWRRKGENGEVRIGMLETIREYASERLNESGEAPPTHKRFAEYFLRMVETAEPELQGSNQMAYLAELDTEYDNVRAALRWALDNRMHKIALRLVGALRWFWTQRSYVNEGYEWAMAALKRPAKPAKPTKSGKPSPSSAGPADPVRAKALWCAGVLAWLRGDKSAALLLEESAQIWRSVGDRRGLAYSLQHLGLLAHREHDLMKMRALELESLESFRAAGDRQGESLAMLCLALAVRELGDAEDAARLLGRCVEICRETGDKWVLALALRELGRVAASRNEYALARPPLEESILLFSELGTKHELAATLDEAAVVESADRDYARAAWLWQQAVSLWRDLGTEREVANDLHSLGHMARIQGNYRAAKVWLSESLATLQPRREPELVCDLLREFGALALAEGQIDRAELLYLAADSLYVGPAGAEAERATGISGPEATLAASISEESLTSIPGPGANKKIISLEQVIEYALDEG